MCTVVLSVVQFFKVGCGVRQGEVLSPQLFAVMYTDDVIKTV